MGVAAKGAPSKSRCQIFYTSKIYMFYIFDNIHVYYIRSSIKYIYWLRNIISEANSEITRVSSGKDPSRDILLYVVEVLKKVIS